MIINKETVLVEIYYTNNFILKMTMQIRKNKNLVLKAVKILMILSSFSTLFSFEINQDRRLIWKANSTQHGDSCINK